MTPTRHFLGTGLVCHETRGQDRLLRYTTPAAAHAIWKMWFPTVAKNPASPFTKILLEHVRKYNDESQNGGVRGDAFEQALLGRVASNGSFQLWHRSLGAFSDEKCTNIGVAFTQCVIDPLSSYDTIPDCTLITMPAEREARFVAVYYLSMAVIFLEATIGAYTDSNQGKVSKELEKHPMLDLLLSVSKNGLSKRCSR